MTSLIPVNPYVTTQAEVFLTKPEQPVPKVEKKPVEETVDISKDYVKLDDGTWVNRAAFETLSTEDQAKLIKVGVDTFNKESISAQLVKEGITQLKNGEYIKTEDFNKLSATDQQKLQELGIAEYNKYAEINYLKVNNIMKLGNGEYVNTTEYDKLTKEQQDKLNEIGVKGFNEWRIVQGQAELQAKIDAVTPKIVPLKAGTGEFAGFTAPLSGLYVRTARGDVPAWMLVPDLKNAFEPSGSPAMGTSYGPTITPDYPFQSPQEKRIVTWGEGRQAREGHFKGSDGQDYWIDENAPSNESTVWKMQHPGIELTPINWTEDTYLAFIGIGKGDIPNRMLTHLSYKGADQLVNSLVGDQWNYIDPETGEKKSTSGLVNPYGLLDQSGKLIGPMGARPIYGSGVWTVQAATAMRGVTPAINHLTGLETPTPAPKTMSSQSSIPGGWPISVETALVPKESAITAKIAEVMNRAEVKAQIVASLPAVAPVMAEQLINGQSYYQTKDNQYVLKADFDSLDPKYQVVLKDQGWQAYQMAINNDFVKLPSNELIDKSAYNKLDPRYQAILQSGGMNAYKNAIDMEYASIPSGKGSILVSRTDIAQLPDTQQYVFKEQGYEGLAKFVAENQQRLKGFTYTDSEGKSIVDILTAMRSGQEDAVKNLYSDKQIQAAIQGKVITPKLDTSGNIIQTAESAGHWIMDELMIAGESLASPAVVSKMASGYVQVYDIAKDKLLSSTVDLKDNDLNKAITANKDYQAFNDVVNTEVKAGLDGMTRYADTFAIPYLNSLGVKGQQLVKSLPPGAESLAGFGLGALSVNTIILATILATLTSAAAHGALGQEQKASEMVTGLGVGAAAWFLTRPAAIAIDPAFEGPYTVGMLVGLGKLKDMAKDTIVKVSPFPQKGTSIEAMGIDPSDVSRVNTPPGVSPTEARQVLEIIESNSANMLGAENLAKILGETRDQVNITTDSGLAKGHLMVSGLQRAIPNLLHHASGGEFGNTLVKDLNTKGYFEVKALDTGRGSVEFASPQLAGAFLKENPVIMNGLWSIKDFKKLPKDIATDLGSVVTMKEARDKFYQYAYDGKLEKGIYPLVKWYGDKATLEYELMATPDFRWNTIKAPWYAQQEGVNTATTFTTSPISYPEMGIVEGQRVPMYWVMSDNAKMEGRTMPSLTDLYRAEVYSTITYLRKALPQNMKLRDITTSEEGPASTRLMSSKLKAISLKGPDWAKDINQVIDRVNSGQLEPYYRQRATAIVVDQNGKMVTVQEQNGRWSLPGGKIEGGNTSIETILRELKEETGIKNPYRYERVGTIKDTVPLTSDQGSVLWRDGKPVYNEHHVYLVKVSRGDKPIPKGEIKDTAKVNWKDGLRFKRTESFVSSVLHMVNDQMMADFLAQRRGNRVNQAAVNSAQSSASWSTNKTNSNKGQRSGKNVVDEEGGAALPYRLKIKPKIGELEPVVATVTTMIEPDIFTSYEDSVKTAESIPASKGEGYQTTGEGKEALPEQNVTGEKPLKAIPAEPKLSASENKPYTEPSKYNPPYTKPSVYSPPYGAKAEKIPTETIPKEVIPKEMIPNEKTTTNIFTDKITTNKIIKDIIPIKTTTIIIKTKHGERVATQEQLEGAIAWKQGIMYIAWIEPFNQSSVIYTRKPIPSVKYFTGSGSAAKSIVALHGEVPSFLHANMGIVDINVKGQGAAQPLLTFKEDKYAAQKPHHKSGRKPSHKDKGSSIISMNENRRSRLW